MRRHRNRQVTDLGQFFNTVEQLLMTLKRAFPEDTDLSYYEDKFSATRKINPRLVVEKLMDVIAPLDDLNQNYIDQIMTQNEKFFFQLNYTKLTDDNYYLKLIQKIQNLWLRMTPTSQEMISKYFQIFVTLGIKITKRADLLPIINKYRDIPLRF